MNIQHLVRKNIFSMKPYSTARDECIGVPDFYMDANENPFSNGYNRYPDPHQVKLKNLISKIKNVPESQIFLGNGSDEAIDLCFRIFCNPGKDNVIAVSPSYGMYSTAAHINDVELRIVSLTHAFEISVDEIIATSDANTKLIFLCSPNNPTANCFSRADIVSIIEKTSGLVVLDEAYIDFADSSGFLKDINRYGNLIILQTLSKAWGLAGLRLGMAFASQEIISLFSRVKYPYNINAATIEIAMKYLNVNRFDNQVKIIKSERERLHDALLLSPYVKYVYPSEANFLLLRLNDAKRIYDRLLKQGIIVRDRSTLKLCENCLRITVGTPYENDMLLRALEVNRDEKCSARIGNYKRSTRETSIEVTLSLDGGLNSSINTGLNFFNHMLDQLVIHGGISLIIKCIGDLNVDEHHLIEDTAIALGEAVKRALGDKHGIERYGFALPMDDCSALVLLDFSGRVDFEWDVNFTIGMIGDMPSEMFKHFFKSLAAAMQCNLHIAAKGENNHHIAESVFKAFARTIRQAVKHERFNYNIPSSKGLL